MPGMDPLRRPWFPLIALTGLLPVLLFRRAGHPAFQIIRMFSLPLACLAIGSLVGSLIPQSWISPSRWRERFSQSSSVNWRLPLAVFICALALFSFTRSFLISSRPDDIRLHYLLTGDEPSYLLITHSLVFDGDLDLSNNRQDTVHFSRHPLLGNQQFGFNFYNRIAQGRLSGKEKDWGDRQYFINRPGLPLLIAPAYWIGFQADKRIRFTVLVWLNLIAAFFIVVLFYLAKTLSGPIPAAAAALVFAVTPPVLFYSNQIYPELPAALCLAGALWGLIKAEKKWEILLTGLAVACFPWFHERFIGMFLVLLAAAFFRPDFRRGRVLFLILPILSLILQGMYYHSFYGLPFPLNSHKPLNVSAVPRGLLAMLTDRDKGLLFLNPLMALSFFGLIPLWRQDRRLAVTLSALLLAYLLPVAAFPDWHGGICPPLRYWVTVVPLAIIPAMALGNDDSRLFSRAGMVALGAWGVWMGIVLVFQPKLWFWQYGPLFRHPDFQSAHVFFPGYIHPEAQSKYLSLFWISLLGLFPCLDRLRRFKKNGLLRRPVFPWIPLVLTAGILIISIGSWLIKK